MKIPVTRRILEPRGLVPTGKKKTGQLTCLAVLQLIGCEKLWLQLVFPSDISFKGIQGQISRKCLYIVCTGTGYYQTPSRGEIGGG